MKRIFFAALMLVIIAGCKNDTSTPKGTVNALFEAMKNGDVNSIKKLVTKNDASLIDMAENAAKMFNPDGKAKDIITQEFKDKAKDASYTVLDEKIDGNNATVNVEVKKAGESKTIPFKLIKEDGSWKVSLLSSGMNAGGMNTDIENDLENFNVDSLPGKESFEKGMNQFKDMNVDSIGDKAKEMFEKMDKSKMEEAAKKWEEEAKKLNGN